MVSPQTVFTLPMHASIKRIRSKLMKFKVSTFPGLVNNFAGGGGGL